MTNAWTPHWLKSWMTTLRCWLSTTFRRHPCSWPDKAFVKLNIKTDFTSRNPQSGSEGGQRSTREHPVTQNLSPDVSRPTHQRWTLNKELSQGITPCLPNSVQRHWQPVLQHHRCHLQIQRLQLGEHQIPHSRCPRSCRHRLPSSENLKVITMHCSIDSGYIKHPHKADRPTARRKHQPGATVVSDEPEVAVRQDCHTSPLVPGQQIGHQDHTGKWREGEILWQCEEPRSYIIYTPQGQELGRNWVQLRDIPQESPATQEPTSGPLAAATPNNKTPVVKQHKPTQAKPAAAKQANANTSYIKRSGRAIYPPAKFDIWLLCHGETRVKDPGPLVKFVFSSTCWTTVN